MASETSPRPSSLSGTAVQRRLSGVTATRHPCSQRVVRTLRSHSCKLFVLRSSVFPATTFLYPYLEVRPSPTYLLQLGSSPPPDTRQTGNTTP